MEQIRSGNAPAAIGPYSQAIRCGNLVFCSGQLGLDAGTGKLVGDTVEAQTREALHNLRAKLSGVIYGDQVPFVRAELFQKVGGYREEIDMEDVELGTRLKRRVRPCLLDLTVTTSSRRFDRAGDLRATFHAALLLANWTFFRRVGRSRTFFSAVR